jgi:hypothetical protein
MSDTTPPNEDDSFRTQFWVKRWDAERSESKIGLTVVPQYVK